MAGFKKSNQVTAMNPLAAAAAGRDPNTKAFHAFKSSAQLAAANFSVINAGNTANTLTFAAAGAGVSHVLSSLTVSAAGGTVGTLLAAFGTLTSDNTNVSDGETVTIDTKVYTFKTALTPTEGQVLIGGSADASLLNLINAINHTGTPGTDYSVAVKHPTVSAATSVTAHAFAITALIPGAQGNAIASTETSAHLSFGGAVLASGAGAMVQIKDGTTIVWNTAIAAAGQIQFCFDPPLKGTANTAMVVTISAAGSNVLTTLSASKWTE